MPTVVEWAPAADPRPHAIVNLIFDSGEVDISEQTVKLRTEELDSYAFVSPGEAARLLPEVVAQRVPAGLEARKTGAPSYLFGGVVRRSGDCF
ncbi:hypothetical protein [Dactylosporangium sp. CA-139066]|uniref:hypothetical protein n=1 Tax=Dactylosporangium sp. CA-139066 TaxID=3239930 RepID=UPI003D8DAC6F